MQQNMPRACVPISHLRAAAKEYIENGAERTQYDAHISNLAVRYKDYSYNELWAMVNNYLADNRANISTDIFIDKLIPAIMKAAPLFIKPDPKLSIEKTLELYRLKSTNKIENLWSLEQFSPEARDRVKNTDRPDIDLLFTVIDFLDSIRTSY